MRREDGQPGEMRTRQGTTAMLTTAMLTTAMLATAILATEGCSADGGGRSEAIDASADDTIADSAALDSGAADGLASDDGADDGASGEDGGEADSAGDGAGGGDNDIDDGDAADGGGSTPVACVGDAACNRLLDEAGLCAGTCMPQPQAPHCPRAPLHGLCHPEAAPEPTNVTQTMGDLVIEPLAAPTSAKTGEYHVVRLRLRRPGPGKITVTLGAEAGKHWSLIAASFNQGAKVTIGDAPFDLELTLKATGWDLLDHAHEMAALLIDGKGVPVYSVLTYAGKDAVACGGFSFPPASPDYPQGRCCGGIFYPSAACCADADCPQGICADGRCMTRAPQSRIGRAMALGHLRVLWVVANADGVGTPAICDDETAALRPTLGLDEIEGIFATVLAGRLGPSPDIVAPLQLEWTVRAGLQVGVNVGETNELPYPELRDKIGAALQQAGCKGVDFDDYDVVILSHPQVYLEGFGGHVYTYGWVGLRQIHTPRLTAHELMHTFGAGDLYGDAAANLQWDHALMGLNTGGTKPLSDDVTWAEIGLADVDRNGVIDLVERASVPDGLVLHSVRAHIDKGPTLYLTVDLRASESGTVRKLFYAPEDFDLALVGTDVHSALDPFKAQAQFEGAVLDSVGAKIGGTIKVRIKGSHSFTGTGFVRQTLSLDQELSIPIEAP